MLTLAASCADNLRIVRGAADRICALRYTHEGIPKLLRLNEADASSLNCLRLRRTYCDPGARIARYRESKIPGLRSVERMLGSALDRNLNRSST